MADLIGPTFGSELITAGAQQGVSWNAATGELTFSPDVSSDAQAKAQAVLAAHDPSKQLPKVQLTFLEFMALFTPAEQAAIVGSTDVQVKIFLIMAAGATVVELSDPRMGAGLSYLVSLSLITDDRKAAILAGTTP